LDSLGCDLDKGKIGWARWITEGSLSVLRMLTLNEVLGKLICYSQNSQTLLCMGERIGISSGSLCEDTI